jgi:hypothetical protein
VTDETIPRVRAMTMRPCNAMDPDVCSADTNPPVLVTRRSGEYEASRLDANRAGHDPPPSLGHLRLGEGDATLSLLFHTPILGGSGLSGDVSGSPFFVRDAA